MVNRWHRMHHQMANLSEGKYVLHSDYLSLETQLQAWHKIFETTQLTHAKARLDAAESRQGLLREALREALDEWLLWLHDRNPTSPKKERIAELRKQFLGGD